MASVFFLLCIIYYTAHVEGANISCPDTFIDGQESSVTCRFNRTAEIENGCFEEHANPLFDLTTNGTESFVCDSQSASTDTQSDGSCRCVESSSELITCTLRLKANRMRHEKGLVMWKLCILKNSLKNNSTTCQIKFSNHAEETTRKDKGTEIITATVLAVIIALAVVVVLVILLCQCRRAQNFTGDCFQRCLGTKRSLIDNVPLRRTTLNSPKN